MSAERISKYYADFRDRDVGDLVIKIAPLKNEVPEIRSIGLDPRDKSFNIEFIIENEGAILAFNDKYIEIYLGSCSGKVARIKIHNISNIRDIIVQFHKSVGEFKAQSFKKIKDAATLGEKLGSIGKYDMLERQLLESEDLLKQADNAY